MATEADHLQKADSNQAFLDTITDEFPDWIATVGFYKAVHLVEALFARRGCSSHTHRQRNFMLRKNHIEIWRDFQPLYNASKLLRYTNRTMPVSKVRNELIGKRLARVENAIRQELEQPS